MIQLPTLAEAIVARPRPIQWMGLLLLALVTGVATSSAMAAAMPSAADRCEMVGPLESGGEGDRSVVSWSTSRELGVVGFDLLKRKDLREPWIAVNTALIAASNSPAGASYSILLPTDPAAATSEWIVRVWTEDAQLTDHPTRIVPVRTATDPRSSRTRKVPSHSLADSSTETGPRLMGSSGGGPLTTVVSVDVLTRRAGVHFLGFTELAAAFQVPVDKIVRWADQGQLSLRQQGVRLPSWGDATSGGRYFFAPRLESLFFEGNVTQLCFEETPLRMTGEVVPPGLNAEGSHGQTRVVQERNLQPVPTLPGAAEDDFWVWDSFLGGHPTFGARSYLFDLPGLVSTVGTATVEVELSSVSEVGSIFSVLLNGRDLGSRAWSGRQRRTLRFEADPAWLQSTTNTLRIVSSGDRVSLGYLDRFSLDYPRRLQPTNGPILFESVEARILEVAGPSGSIVEVWDVTTPAQPVRLEQSDSSAGPGTFRFPGLSAHKYVTFLRGAAIPVDRLQAFGPDALRDPANRAEYLAVAPDSLVSAAAALAGRRAAQGLSSRVIALSDIHHAFADGLPTPDALARFVAHARSTWAVPPRYLMIIGDGTYDYRGYSGQKDNLVPPLVVSSVFGRAVTDERFGDLDGDGRPEVAVGRLPVRNEAELVRLIGQMDDFASRTVLAPRAVLLADRPDEGGEFIRNAEELASILEPAFSVERIFNEALETSVVRDLLFQKLRSGMNVFNYVGHGGRDRFGSAYLTVSDAETTEFGTQQPLVVAMTCAAGQFGLPGTSCLGEALLLKSGRAPIAVWSPSGFSIDLQAHPLNLLLVTELSRQPVGTRLGDTLRRVVTAYRDQGGDEVTPALYNLLGDPAVPLNFGGPAPSLSAWWTGERLQLQLSGAPGATYQLMASDRLDRPEWVVLGEVTADASGEVGFPVVVSPEIRQRFFRAEYRR